jgi:hypothetical protein
LKVKLADGPLISESLRPSSSTPST